MFFCQVTKRLTKPGEKCHKITVETRERTYKDEKGNEIGKGREIVKEINAGDEGYRVWLAAQATADVATASILQ